MLSISPRESKLVTSNITSPVLQPQYSPRDGPHGSSNQDARQLGLPPQSPRNAQLKLHRIRVPLFPPHLGAHLPPQRRHDDLLLLTNNEINTDNRIAFRPNTTAPQAVFNPGSSTDSNFGADRNFTQYILQKILGTVITDGLARAASNGSSHAVFPHNTTAIAIRNIGAAHGLEAHQFLFDWSGAGTGFASSSVPTNGIALARGERNGGITQEAVMEALARGTTQFVFEAERFGYGSGKPGPTVDFALCVMYIYLGIVAVYFLRWGCEVGYDRCWGGGERVMAVGAWGSMETLLWLVWNSAPR